MRRESKLEIICERDYLGETDALRRLHGVTRDRRADGNLVHFEIDAEVLEGTLDDICVRLDIADTRLTFIGT